MEWKGSTICQQAMEKAPIFSTKHLYSVVLNGLNQETASTCSVALATEDYKVPDMPRIVFGLCFNEQLCCAAGPVCVNIGLLKHHSADHTTTRTKCLWCHSNVSIDTFWSLNLFPACWHIGTHWSHSLYLVKDDAPWSGDEEGVTTTADCDRMRDLSIEQTHPKTPRVETTAKTTEQRTAACPLWCFFLGAFWETKRATSALLPVFHECFFPFVSASARADVHAQVNS